MQDLYDVIVVGGGPSGLTSAIYLARAKYRVLVLEKEKFGGQITITEEIVNYPGVERTSGKALTEAMRVQAEHFGAGFTFGNVTELELDGNIKKVRLSEGREYQTLGIVLALGASPRKLGFVGEKEFQGRGVAYCATCDGEFFTGREVLVIGGGFAAVEESVFLTKYATKVTMIVREEDFTCAAGVAEQVRNHPSIQVRFHTEVKEAGGDGALTHATLYDNQTGESEVFEAEGGKPFGIFVFAGYEPATKWLQGKIALNEQGYIITDREQATAVLGVYAAGDVCIKRLRQVVTAVGDGAVAATSLEKYVSELRERMGLPKADNGGSKADKGGTKVDNGGFRVVDRGDTPAGVTKDLEAAEGTSADDAFINSDMKRQLAGLFERFERNVEVVVVSDGSATARELEGFVRELEGISRKLTVSVEQGQGGVDFQPYIDIRTGERSAGIRYYSVPGGHEFNSFVLALYNVAGPGQEIGESLSNRIKAIAGEHRLQVMATLSCTNCPDVVAGSQRIAALNSGIRAEMYDLSKFPEYKERYQIMAVPCMILDGEKTFFGKKGLEEIVTILEQPHVY